MLRINDLKQTVHVNPAEPFHTHIPSKREVLAAFERMLEQIEEVNEGGLYVDLTEEISVLRIYLATR